MGTKSIWDTQSIATRSSVSEHGPGIKRAYTYKALNRLIQGSAADMTKKAMVDLYKEGIIPHIQVHDELDISVDNNADKIKEIMESAVQLEVPNKVDYESGPNWGTIKMRLNYGLFKCKHTSRVCTDQKRVFV